MKALLDALNIFAIAKKSDVNRPDAHLRRPIRLVRLICLGVAGLALFSMIGAEILYDLTWQSYRPGMAPPDVERGMRAYRRLMDDTLTFPLVYTTLAGIFLFMACCLVLSVLDSRNRNG